MELLRVSVGCYCIGGTRENEAKGICRACTNAGNPESLRQAAGGRQGSAPQVGDQGQEADRLGLLQLRGGGQRERTELALSSKRITESSEPS